MPTFRVEDFEDQVEEKEAPPVVEQEEEEEEEEVVEAEAEEEDEQEEEEEEKKPALTKADLNSIIDTEDLPEELRGKSVAELVRMFNSTRSFAQGLYARINGEKEASAAAPRQPEPEEDGPLFSEDELGVGADPRSVEEKVNALVAKRVQPFITSTLQEKSEANARALLTDETKFPHAKRFAREILTIASQLDVSQTANPGTWQTIYHNLVGANYEILANESRERNPSPKPKTGLGTKGNNRRVRGGDDSKRPTLSPEQRQVAEAMGISEEDFIKNAQKMGIKLNGKL